MPVEIQIVSADQLTQEAYKQLQKLTFAPSKGEMRQTLQRAYRSGNDRVLTLQAYQDGQLVGWALTSKHHTMFYVRRSCRRQGIGTMLYRAVLTVNETVYVYSTDRLSSRFFNALKYKFFVDDWGDFDPVQYEYDDQENIVDENGNVIVFEGEVPAETDGTAV